MTSQEAIVKKEIHIVGQRVKYYREKRGMEWTIVNKVDRKIKKAIQIGQEPKGY